MMKFNREEGLTLIELLITIAVLAIVAAIAVPVITNVVNSTEDRAVAQTQSDIRDFADKYENTGAFAVSGSDTTTLFEGYVDLNGDGNTSADEKIEELAVDNSKFAVSNDGTLVAVDGSTDITADYDAPDSSVWTVAEAN